MPRGSAEVAPGQSAGWKRLLAAGVSTEASIDQQRRTTTVNLFTLCTSLFYALCAASYFGAPSEWAARVSIVHAMASMVTLGLNAAGFTRMGRAWLILNVNLSVLAFMVILGAATGVETLYLTSVCLPLVLFDAREHRFGVFASIVLPVVLYAAARSFLATHLPLDPLPEARAAGYFLATQAAAAISLMLIVGHYYALTARVGHEQSEERFRQVLRQATDAMLLVDADGVIVEANDRARALFEGSYAEVVGRSLAQLDPGLDEPLRGSLAAIARKRGSAMHTHVLRAKDGTEHPLEMHVGLVEYGDSHYLLFAARDISERKRLEAQLMLADRMVSVGTLAAGVAHEINNPLTALMLNLELIERQLVEVSPYLADERVASLARGIKRAREGGERVGTIVRDLKTFSRDEADARTEVDVRAVIESTLGLAHPELRRHATVVLEYEGHCLVRANQSRLGQVVLNLALNAAHAFGGRPVAENRITVRAVSSDDDVMLEVADNGPGMSVAVAARVFDPFFTTKPAGVGTGLGLFICRNIIEGFDGRIEVSSVPGEGATFRVYLPAAGTAQVPQRSSTRHVIRGSWPPDGLAAPVPSPPPLMTRPSRILIIDDEPSVVMRTLEEVLVGHRVELARDADEARSMIQQGAPYDLVLCDFDLHTQSDGAAYRAARGSVPPLAKRWVFMTGTPGKLPVPDNDVLEKPVRGEALWDLLREGAA